MKIDIRSGTNSLKKLQNSVLLSFLILGSSVHAHILEQPFSQNTFETTPTEAKEESNSFGSANKTSTSSFSRPGGPGEPEPVPIDDALPVLIIAAVAILVYYRKRIGKQVG